MRHFSPKDLAEQLKRRPGYGRVAGFLQWMNDERLAIRYSEHFDLLVEDGGEAQLDLVHAAKISRSVMDGDSVSCLCRDQSGSLCSNMKMGPGETQDTWLLKGLGHMSQHAAKELIAIHNPGRRAFPKKLPTPTGVFACPSPKQMDF